MSALSKEQITHIANLARLSVPEVELEKLSGELGAILSFVDQINAVKIETTNPARPLLENIVREDIVLPLESAYNLVEAAPLHKDGFVQVPKVIGE